MGEIMRLDKFLADMGKGSRSQVKEAGKKGRIYVNGQVEKILKRKIDPNIDQVTLTENRCSTENGSIFF